MPLQKMMGEVEKIIVKLQYGQSLNHLRVGKKKLKQIAYNGLRLGEGGEFNHKSLIE